MFRAAIGLLIVTRQIKESLPISDDSNSPHLECYQLVFGKTTIECVHYYSDRPHEVKVVLMDNVGTIIELRTSDNGKLQFQGTRLEFGKECVIKSGKRVAKVILRGTSRFNQMIPLWSCLKKIPEYFLSTSCRVSRPQTNSIVRIRNKGYLE